MKIWKTKQYVMFFLFLFDKKISTKSIERIHRSCFWQNCQLFNRLSNNIFSNDNKSALYTNRTANCLYLNKFKSSYQIKLNDEKKVFNLRDEYSVNGRVVQAIHSIWLWNRYTFSSKIDAYGLTDWECILLFRYEYILRETRD